MVQAFCRNTNRQITEGLEICLLAWLAEEVWVGDAEPGADASINSTVLSPMLVVLGCIKTPNPNSACRHRQKQIILRVRYFQEAEAAAPTLTH